MPHAGPSTFTSGVRHAEALLHQAGEQRGGHIAQFGGCAVQLQGLQYVSRNGMASGWLSMGSTIAVCVT